MKFILKISCLIGILLGLITLILHFIELKQSEKFNIIEHTKIYNDRLLKDVNKVVNVKNKDFKTINFPSNKVPYVIFAIWFGKINKIRQKCIDSIKNLGVDFVLITEDNLKNYIKDGFPLHPAFYYLSGIDRSDYLRAYLMHHYGGGYTDVKPYDSDKDWTSSFEKINNNENIWILGHSEAETKDIACHTFHKLDNENWTCRDVKKNAENLINNAHYICRPYTKLTYEWINRLHLNLTKKINKLIDNPPPSHRCCFNHEGGYPLRWAESCGEILHPLEHIYNEHVFYGIPTYNNKGVYMNENENTQSSNPFTVLDLVNYKIDLPIEIINLCQENIEDDLVALDLPLKNSVESYIDNFCMVITKPVKFLNRNLIETVLWEIMNEIDFDVLILGTSKINNEEEYPYFYKKNNNLIKDDIYVFLVKHNLLDSCIKGENYSENINSLINKNLKVITSNPQIIKS